MFSFPPLQPGDSSIQNWYQDLLDHPDCKGDPLKVQQAYESSRQSNLIKAVKNFTSELPLAKITPDEALIRHLEWQKRNNSSGTDPSLDYQNVNCLVFWARPSNEVQDIIGGIQQRLAGLLGPDFHPIPPPDQHVSVLELSHQHSVPELQQTYHGVSQPTVQEIVNLPVSVQQKNHQTIGLVRPLLMFDGKGVAVTFIPDAPQAEQDAETPESGNASFTYQHLRSEMHKLALKSGIKIDTCYTAPTAHVTIGRFIGDSFFTPQPTVSEKLVDGTSPVRRFVELIRRINEELEQMVWNDLRWVIARDRGLECQFGYVKFGRSTDCAADAGERLKGVES